MLFLILTIEVLKFCIIKNGRHQLPAILVLIIAFLFSDSDVSGTMLKPCTVTNESCNDTADDNHCFHIAPPKLIDGLSKLR